jgi:hypothetical protein
VRWWSGVMYNEIQIRSIYGILLFSGFSVEFTGNRRMIHKIFSIHPQTRLLNGQAIQSSAARLRSSPRWLAMGRAGWWVVTLISIVLIAAAVPVSIAHWQEVCLQTTCFYQLDASQVQQLQALGISLSQFAFGHTFLLALVSAVYILVGFLLYQHKSSGWIGLLGAYTLVLFGAISLADTPVIVIRAYPALQFPIRIMDYFGNILLPLFIILFPDGRLKPRWTIGLVVAWAILRIPTVFFPGSFLDLDYAPIWVQIVLWAGFIGSLVLVQYYRYRKLYGPVLRQQTK